MYLLRLGGSGACSPRTFLLFVCSEINSGAYSETKELY